MPRKRVGQKESDKGHISLAFDTLKFNLDICVFEIIIRGLLIVRVLPSFYPHSRRFVHFLPVSTWSFDYAHMIFKLLLFSDDASLKKELNPEPLKPQIHRNVLAISVLRFVAQYSESQYLL